MWLPIKLPSARPPPFRNELSFTDNRRASSLASCRVVFTRREGTAGPKSPDAVATAQTRSSALAPLLGAIRLSTGLLVPPPVDGGWSHHLLSACLLACCSGHHWVIS